MTKLITPLVATLCFAAALALGLLVFQPKTFAADAIDIGQPAPDFTLKDVTTGSDVTLSDHKGKVVVAIFHSTSCPWYRMREDGGYDRVFVKMVEAYKDKDVVFLGINSNRTESVDKVKKYVADHNINYTVVKDPGNTVADAMGAKVTPHVFVIDQQGKLRYHGGVEKRPSNPGACGQSDEQYLGPVIDALLKGTEPPVTETKAVGCGIKRV